MTKWSKCDTVWEVTIDDVLAAAGIAPPTGYLLAESHDGYDTNLPVADLVDGRAMIATRYGGAPVPAEHGGPTRLLVPHLYFWKSVKWVKGLRWRRCRHRSSARSATAERHKARLSRRVNRDVEFGTIMSSATTINAYRRRMQHTAMRWCVALAASAVALWFLGASVVFAEE